jgi:hypothetical protein
LLCASDSVEDEHHFVFECPLYESLRFDFAELFHKRHTLDSFLIQNQERVAAFIYACSEQRRQVAQMSLAGSGNA